MLLLHDAHIGARRGVATGGLWPLSESLAHDLDVVIARDLYIPEEKALLSRAGGRCEADGTQLEFDPFSPHEHRCTHCGATFRGDLHDRWWIYPYQLWLAERAVHGAALYLTRGDERHGRFARDVLRRYAELYEHYPNRDNVLGPTRLFFSTYLESIWLLQLCVATDLLDMAGDHSAGQLVRDKIIEPSSRIIRQYDEGMSNRQVWNNAALFAASSLLGDRESAARIVSDSSGIEAHLAHGLLADGTWYEGENYHLFAHRGLWYGVTMAECAGIPLDATLVARFQEGFATPFATALPDFTFPARKDSQYAVSLRQWRYAELCELGLARRDDRRLIGALARVYDETATPGDTGRWRSSGEAERNVPPVKLSRADLGWRSLLHARDELPPLEPLPVRSAHLEQQGFTTFRRDGGSIYVALDWGQSGGGHGHPDRLNLLFAHGDARWLDDLGTGSYVDASLHWYRSTLAHNAPLANGHSQQRTDGRVLAHDERGGFGWILAEANVAPGVRMQRALIVSPDYFVDELRWTSDAPAHIDLPMHFDAAPAGATFVPAPLDGGNGLEDGFEFAREGVVTVVSAGTAASLTAEREGRRARAWVCADGDVRWFNASAPGQPATATRRFNVLRTAGTSGAIRSVWAWSSRVTDVAFKDDHIHVSLGAERHEHWLTPDYWQVELSVGAAHSGIELFGWTRPTVQPAHELWHDAGALRAASVASMASAASAPPRELRRNGASTAFMLGEQHYRRSEQTWDEAGAPTATVTLSLDTNDLVIDVDAKTGPIVFADDDGENKYDNEHPDINADGVQLYVGTATDGGAWVVLPDPAYKTARARALPEWGSLELRSAEWAPTDAGFTMQIRVPLLPNVDRVDIDVLINETTPDRRRRRGQLVLSGGGAEFVYLRGDRHDPSRLIPIVVRD